MISLFNWSTFSGSNQTFCLSFEDNLQQTAIFSFKCQNKRFQSYDWSTKKLFWSASKKWFKNIR